MRCKGPRVEGNGGERTAPERARCRADEGRGDVVKRCRLRQAPDSELCARHRARRGLGLYVKLVAAA